MPTRNSHSDWRVSFIIPAMNEETMISGVLESISRLQQSDTISVAEVIAVDSGSTDATADVARAAGCRVIAASPGNVSRSRNVGAARASGNVLAFVDADCELPRDWLLQCVGELKAIDVVAAGMTMAAPAPGATWIEHTWFELAHRQATEHGSADAPWLASFNLVVRADAFRAVGAFDETLVTCEDVDLGYRLQSAGRLRVVRDAAVVHHGESKSLRVFARRESWRARGGWRLLFHHRSSLRELISCLIPFVVTTSLLAGLAGSVRSPLCLLVGGLPLLALVVRSRVTWQRLPAALLLQAVYCASRCRGMLWPAGRVERSSPLVPAVRPSTGHYSQDSSPIMSLTAHDSKVD